MKIKLTESQFNRLIIVESKEIEFNFDSDTILGFAELIDLNLKGQNKFLGDKALTNKNILSKIYLIMSDVDEKNKMVDDLNNKGMVDSDKKLIGNIETIINNFNNHSKKTGLNKILDLKFVLNKILR